MPCVRRSWTSRWSLVKKTAHGEGATAYLSAFKQSNPANPALTDSGRRYKDGQVKSTGRMAYEAVYDRILAENQISNSERFRAD